MIAQDKFKKGDWVETIDAGYHSDIPYGTRGVVVGFTCVSSGGRADGEGGDLVIVDFGPEYGEFNKTFGKRVGKTYAHKFLKNLSREEEGECREIDLGDGRVAVLNIVKKNLCS